MKGEESELRSQEKEYVNGERMSLLKRPNFDFLVWEIIFSSFNCGGVCYQHCRAEDRESSVLPGTLG